MEGENDESNRPPADDETENWWNEAYEETPPWDLGRPQPAFARLAEAGSISGRVLDAGCGTGTHALYFAARGHSVVGVDLSMRAIERARAKARRHERTLDVAFRVADVTDLDADRDVDFDTFDTVVDSGLLHVFEGDARVAYVESLAGTLRSGGRAFVLAFGDGAPDDWGPIPLSRADFERTFDDGWTVHELRETSFETRAGDVPAYLATVERC